MSHDNWLTCMRTTTTTYFSRTICTHTCGYRCLPHGCFVRKNYDGKGVIYNSLCQRRAVLESYKGIDIHLVTSNYLKRRLVQHGFTPDQVVVVGCFIDRKSTRLNSSHLGISYAVFCLKKKNITHA